MSAAAFVACGSGAYAAPRGRMSAKSGYCSWSCSMWLFISFMNYPIGAVTPLLDHHGMVDLGHVARLASQPSAPARLALRLF